MWNPKADCQLTSCLSDTLFLNILFEFLHTVLSSGLQSFMVCGPSWGQPVSTICLLSGVAVSSQMSQSGLNTSRKCVVTLSGMDKTTTSLNMVRIFPGRQQPSAALLHCPQIKIIFWYLLSSSCSGRASANTFPCCYLYKVEETGCLCFPFFQIRWKNFVGLGNPHMRSKYQV